MILHRTANFRSLRDSYLCTYIAPSREDVRNKLRQILRMTKFGDWLMFYLLAHNMDKASEDDILIQISQIDCFQVNFTELIDLGVNYPGYRDNASQQCF